MNPMLNGSSSERSCQVLRALNGLKTAVCLVYAVESLDVTLDTPIISLFVASRIANGAGALTTN